MREVRASGFKLPYSGFNSKGGGGIWFGLLLGAIGLYGVMAYVVRQRAHEIGIRLALGAQIRDVIALIVRQGMAVCAAGGAIGLVIAFVATRFLDGVLYGISAADPVTFTAVPLVLAGVALLACYLPAHRAAGVDVLRALRRE